MQEHVSSEQRPRARWLFALPWDITEIGGVSQVVKNLIRLAAHSQDVSPLLFIPDYDAPRALHSRVGDVDTVRLRVIGPWVPGEPAVGLLTQVLRWPRNVWRLCKLLRAIRPAGVNAHYPGLWCLTMLVALRLTCPHARLVLSFHGADVQRIEEGSSLARFWWRLLVRSADAVTCCSDNLRARLAAAVGISSDYVVTIHNGIDRSHLEAAVARAASPPALEGKTYILNLGTLEHKKGQDVLVRAFPAIRRRHPNLFLVIAGRTGPARDELASQIERLGLGDCVLLFSDLAHGDALAVMREATVFVLSSRQEPFGIVLLEAMHFEVPIVATNVGGIPEVVTDQRSALLVPPDDASALTNAVLRIVDDQVKRDELIAGARTVVREFAWEVLFERYKRLVMQTPTRRRR